MILSIDLAQANLLNEVLTQEVNYCLSEVRRLRREASHPFDRCNANADRLENRINSTLDILNELYDARMR